MTLTALEAREKCGRVLDHVCQAIVGKRDFLELFLTGLIADGHLLIEDVPGLAKTLTAQMFAQALDLRFSRIQFVPDLLPSDITGGVIYNPTGLEFQFRPGPVFTNILLADEINRGTPKTQAALLEAMQENQVTSDGRSYPLDPPFIVIATQNPIEFEGTYPLPEAQLDRFLCRLSIGYPDESSEVEILKRRLDRRADLHQLATVMGRDEFMALREAAEHVHVHADVQNYIVRLVAHTRGDRRVYLGASPRGSLALLKLARARALMLGRDYVIPEDVKATAVPALAHRVVLKPELWVERLSSEEVVKEALSTVATPKVEM